MDCITNYYERLSALKVKDSDLEKATSYMSRFYPKGGLFTDLTSDSISEDYFGQVDSVAEDLISFFDENVARPECVTLLYEDFDFPIENGAEDLKLFFLADIIRCYRELNHPTNLASAEGVALLVLLTKAYYPEFRLGYDTLKEIPETIINVDSIVPYIAECSEDIDSEAGILVISKVLHDINPAADVVYRKLVYKFCKAVSEVDGAISESETECLNALLRLDDEDKSNDIVVD